MTLLPIRLDNVGCQLSGRDVLRGVTATIQEPGIVGLIGRNGSGKSTLLQVMAGLLPMTGHITYGSQLLNEFKPQMRAQLIGWQPQEISLPFGYRALDVVVLGRYPQHRGAPTVSDYQRATEALKLADAWPLADHPVDALSRGELQKVSIARTLAADASVLLFDEPTASLDMASTLRFFAVLQDLRAQGVTSVVALHDISLAWRFCDTVLGLRSGHCVMHARPEQALTPEICSTLFDVRITLLRNGEETAIVYHSSSD